VYSRVSGQCTIPVVEYITNITQTPKTEVDVKDTDSVDGQIETLIVERVYEYACTLNL